MTIAGVGSTSGPSNTGGPATSATLNNLCDVKGDGLGYIYVAEFSGGCARRFSLTTGIMEAYAGLCGAGSGVSNNVAATSAYLLNPLGLAFDSQLSLYVSQYGGDRISKIPTSGMILTNFAGKGAGDMYNTGDWGQATSASLYQPRGMWFDTQGSMFLVTGGGNQVKKINSAGIVSNIAGSGSYGASSDGEVASSAPIQSSYFIVGDTLGNLFFTENANLRVRSITASGTLGTLAGSGSLNPLNYVATTINAVSANFNGVIGLTTDPITNDVFTAGYDHYVVAKVVRSSGILRGIVGDGTIGTTGDGGPALNAKVGNIYGMYCDTTRKLFLGDHLYHTVRVVYSIDPSVAPTPAPSHSLGPTRLRSSVNAISTVAGNASPSAVSTGTGGLATAASLSGLTDVSGDSVGYIYISEKTASCVRRFSLYTYYVEAYAGLCDGSTSNPANDVAATAAYVNGAFGIALDTTGALFVSTPSIHSVSKVVRSTSIISNFAGRGSGSNSPTSGAATSAGVWEPVGLWCDSVGNVYIVAKSGFQVRLVNTANIVSIFAGASSGGTSVDGLAATSATLSSCRFITGDSVGMVYISEYTTHRIRSVSSGILSTIVGSGSFSPNNGNDANLAATSLNLYSPEGVAVDAGNGDIYVAVKNNFVVAAITRSTMVASTFAGSGTDGYSGNGGPALSAKFSSIYGLHLDTSNRLYLADMVTMVVRRVFDSSPTISPTSVPTATPSVVPTTSVPTAVPSRPPTFVPTTPGPTGVRSTQNFISTIAGVGGVTVTSSTGTGGKATAAWLYGVKDVKTDSSGYVYVSESTGNCVRRFRLSTAIVQSFAGLCGVATSAAVVNVAATSSYLQTPFGMAFDTQGSFYVALESGYAINKVPSNQIIALHAGAGWTSDNTGDGGQATSAAFYYPRGLYIDTLSNLYVVTAAAKHVKRISASGIVSTTLGTGTPALSMDGAVASSSPFMSSNFITGDTLGTLYLPEYSGSQVRTIINGILGTIAGDGSLSPSNLVGKTLDPLTVSFKYVMSVAVDSGNGDLYVGDHNNQLNVVVTRSSLMASVFVGLGGAGNSGDGGSATSAQIGSVYGTQLDSGNKLYLADNLYNVVRMVYSVSPTQAPTPMPSISFGPTAVRSSQNSITTVAGVFGSTITSGTGARATSASLSYPTDILTDSLGYVYITEMLGDCVRRFSTTTTVMESFAGLCGATTGAVSGVAATSAFMFNPYGLAFDTLGSLHVSQSGSGRISKVSSESILVTVAGTGNSNGNTGNFGPATSAEFISLGGLWIDSQSSVYVATGWNGWSVRRVTTSGIVTAFSGTGVRGISADGVVASSASLDLTQNVCGDSMGRVYIAEGGGNKVRMVTSGILGTVLGSGDLNGDPTNLIGTTLLPALTVKLNNPKGVTVDAGNGDLYAMDAGNCIIAAVTRSSMQASTFAGVGFCGTVSGDGGAATAAQIGDVWGIHLDASNRLFTAMPESGVVRMVYSTAPTNAPTAAPSVSFAPTLSIAPSTAPTAIPSITPTISPSFKPTVCPTLVPSTVPTFFPTLFPTIVPSRTPTIVPSAGPSVIPTAQPSTGPTTVRSSLNSITTVAGVLGSVNNGGTGGKATSATLAFPTDVVSDGVGYIYVSELYGECVRRFSTSSNIMEAFAGLCGSTTAPSSGVAATAAYLNSPFGIAFDTQGSFYAASETKGRISKVSSSGILTIVAGIGLGAADSGDFGPATSADFLDLCGIWIDSLSNIYAASGIDAFRVRRVSSGGIVTPFAGTGMQGISSDGAVASSASIELTFHVSGDSLGKIYLAETGSNRVRTVASGVLGTVLGSGDADGLPQNLVGSTVPALSANLNSVKGLTVDADNGDLYASVADHCIIAAVTRSTMQASAFAGTGSCDGNTGDGGAATAANVYTAWGLHLDTTNRLLYAAIKMSGVVRMVYSTAPTNAPTAAPSISLAPTISEVPSQVPTMPPSFTPTLCPTVAPSRVPTTVPTLVPSRTPTMAPTRTPSIMPTAMPSVDPTTQPSIIPSIAPTLMPTATPSTPPTHSPTAVPTTTVPTLAPSMQPTMVPSILPTLLPTATPSALPTLSPTTVPTTTVPTLAPSMQPTMVPSILPTLVRTLTPSQCPTHAPSLAPTDKPTTAPSLIPTMTPTTVLPSAAPTVAPSTVPTQAPSFPTSVTHSITTLAGVGSGAGSTGTGGRATAASIDTIYDVRADSAGYIYVSELAKCVRRFSTTTSIVEAYAGVCGIATGGVSDVKATAAYLNSPGGMSFDTQGTFHVAQLSGNIVSRVDASQVITTMAGIGTVTVNSGDGGPATSAGLYQPRTLWFDAASNLYVMTGSGKQLKKISAAGLVSNVAGTGVTAVSSNGAVASSAAIGDSFFVTGDSLGVIHFAEFGSHRVRSIVGGVLGTTAGSGSATANYVSETVAATNARFNRVVGIAADTSNGHLYVGDYNHHMVAIVRDGLVDLLAGNYSSGYSGDGGPATAAQIDTPYSVSVDVQGNVLVADSGYNSVRLVFSVVPTSAPTLSLSPSTTPTVVPTTAPTQMPSASPTRTPSTTPSISPTTTTPSISPTTVTPTVSTTTQPSFSPTIVPTAAPTVVPSILPSVVPTQVPSLSPSAAPTITPTVRPSNPPTVHPTTNQPSTTPTVSPTAVPTAGPSLVPSTIPTQVPSDSPTPPPTMIPTSAAPSSGPSASPSILPSSSNPTTLPTVLPTTTHPSPNPTLVPSTAPASTQPTTGPTFIPTRLPTTEPTFTPTTLPTATPTVLPSHGPSVSTVAPSIVHTTAHPTTFPTSPPSTAPSLGSTLVPSRSPSTIPSRVPSVVPTTLPSTGPSAPTTSYAPTVTPTQAPSPLPTPLAPTVSPSTDPTELPTFTRFPTALPSVNPTPLPTAGPTISPSAHPTVSPSLLPTMEPINPPTADPTLVPTTVLPTLSPTHPPTVAPSAAPSVEPTLPPSRVPTTGPTRSSVAENFNTSVSVLGVTSYSFIIVIPFLTLSSGAGVTSAFSDIVLGAIGSAGRAFQISEVSDSVAAVAYAGAADLDSAKRSTAVLESVNGDPRTDLIIGDPYAARCYVLFGGTEGLTNMNTGFTVFGEESSDLTGWSVSGAGDVNNDTIHDIVIGAPFAHDGMGAFYVIYGRNTSNTNLYLGVLSPAIGFAVYGERRSDYLGISVSHAGDVNGDGTDDVIAGAVMTSNYASGAAYVTFGGPTAVQSVSDCWKLVGSSYSYSGYSVAAAGDVNGDGRDDVLIGSAPQREGSEPTSYLVYGDTDQSTLPLSGLASEQGVVLTLGGTVAVSAPPGGGVIVFGHQPATSTTGLLLYTNVSQLTRITASPSLLPTLAPLASRAPSTRPTKAPRSLHPTAPPSTSSSSLLPSLRPSSPTVEPTAAATNLISEWPTVSPTHSPTEGPSVKPTNGPSETPSEVPSLDPSEVPSDAPTDAPTAQPTVIPTTVPTPTVTAAPFATRSPVNRPTVAPTNATRSPTVSSVVIVNEGGLLLNESLPGRQYVINTTEHVTIANSQGSNTYTVLPAARGVLTVVVFNGSSDAIDLRAFRTITHFSHLTITEGSAVIHLFRDQRIHLLDRHPGDMRSEHFLFHEPLSEETTVSRTVVIVSAVAAGVVSLLSVWFLSYRVYRWRQAKFKDGKKITNFLLFTYIEGQRFVDEDESTMVIGDNRNLENLDTESSLGSKLSKHSIQSKLPALLINPATNTEVVAVENDTRILDPEADPDAELGAFSVASSSAMSHLHSPLYSSSVEEWQQRRQAAASKSESSDVNSDGDMDMDSPLNSEEALSQHSLDSEGVWYRRVV